VAHELPEHLRGRFTPSESDSAGQPWAGRELHEHPFQDDDGTSPAAFAAAMAAFRAGEAGQDAVVDALREARVLVPLVARLGESGENEHGVTVDKSAELSIVTVAAPDGRRAVPLFTSTEAMRSWDPKARPVPALMRRAALSVVAEGSEVIVVDATAPTEFVVRRPAVWAIAQDVPWTPAWTDEALARDIAAPAVEEALVRGVEIAPGDPFARFAGPEVVVTLEVDADASPEARDALVARLQAAWSTSESVATRADSLGLSLRAARTPEGAAAAAGPETAAPSQPSESRRSRHRSWLGLRRRPPRD